MREMVLCDGRFWAGPGAASAKKTHFGDDVRQRVDCGRRALLVCSGAGACRSGDGSVRSRVARGLLERVGEERVAESERRAFPAPCSRLVLESCRFIL